ncbi:hypothetical protein DMI65_11635 [Escherichia coli]|nr:hypothetical protein [Escherichia coli]
MSLLMKRQMMAWSDTGTDDSMSRAIRAGDVLPRFWREDTYLHLNQWAKPWWKRCRIKSPADIATQ